MRFLAAKTNYDFTFTVFLVTSWLSRTSRFRAPCRLSLQVVVMVGLERFNNPWVYAAEPLMPDRPKVRDQTKRDKGAYTYTVRERSRITSGTRLLIKCDCASEPETA